MEKAPVPDDRSSEASSELVSEENVSRISTLVVEPRVGVQRRIPMRFEKTTVKFVRSGSSENLHLAGPSTKLSIRGRRDNADFLDDVDAVENDSRGRIDRRRIRIQT